MEEMAAKRNRPAGGGSPPPLAPAIGSLKSSNRDSGEEGARLFFFSRDMYLVPGR